MPSPYHGATLPPVATRKRKPWNAGLKMPGLLGEPESPKPKPMAITAAHAGHSTSSFDLSPKPETEKPAGKR